MASLIPKSRNAMAISLIVLSMLFASVAAREHIVRVNITNGLAQPTPQITVHCKSKDDDLGFHDLAPSATWGFHFHPRFVTGTLFFCSFAWPGNFHYYDIYDYNRDSCNDCCWIVRENGPCLCPCNETCDFKDCRPWNK